MVYEVLLCLGYSVPLARWCMAGITTAGQHLTGLLDDHCPHQRLSLVTVHREWSRSSGGILWRPGLGSAEYLLSTCLPWTTFALSLTRFGLLSLRLLSLSSPDPLSPGP